MTPRACTAWPAQRKRASRDTGRRLAGTPAYRYLMDAMRLTSTEGRHARFSNACTLDVATPVSSPLAKKCMHTWSSLLPLLLDYCAMRICIYTAGWKELAHDALFDMVGIQVRDGSMCCKMQVRSYQYGSPWSRA